jgi:hypothetical protein
LISLNFKQSNRYVLRVVMEAFMFVLAAVGGELAAIEHLFAWAVAAAAVGGSLAAQ